MATLKDFQLKRGDWVKFPAEWREVTEFCPLEFDHKYYPSLSAEVEAVLRPSVVIRDQLDNLLNRERNIHPYTTIPQVLEFREIHPKEEKSTAKLIQIIYDNKGQSSWDAVRVLAAEIDKLKEGKNGN